MKITVHRGIDQIGGCITEISTCSTRIFIDLGMNLPDGDGIVTDSLANIDAIEKLTKDVDAIFYTHNHADHIGLFHLVPEKINQYIGTVAKRVALNKHERLAYIKGREEISAKEIARIEQMTAYRPEQIIKVGNICVTPYFVSHSAYEACMFIIEVDDKRILHTGDFRDHGYLGKGLLPCIKKLIRVHGRIDFLMTEGTMLSRMNDRVRHENELKREAVKQMRKYRNVFVLCSSTDMERLSTFHAANKELINRPFVCDDFQKGVLEIFTDTAGRKSSLFDFTKSFSYIKGNLKLLNWMLDKGFCMLVRATSRFEEYFKSLEPQIEKDKTLLIYSMWEEYINPESRYANKRLLEFVKKFPRIIKVHTSGHASVNCLAKVCNLVNPSMGIIPVHSEQSANLYKLPISEELKSKVILTSRIINGVTIDLH